MPRYQLGRNLCVFTQAVLSLLLCLAPAAMAEDRDPPSPERSRGWEVEVHGGGILSSNPTGGTATALPIGASRTDPAGPSRDVPSWYQGDGAQLFNDATEAGRATIPAIAPLAVREGQG